MIFPSILRHMRFRSLQVGVFLVLIASLLLLGTLPDTSKHRLELDVQVARLVRSVSSELCAPSFRSARHPLLTIGVSESKRVYAGDVKLLNKQMGLCPYPHQKCCRPRPETRDETRNASSMLLYSYEDFRVPQQMYNHALYEMWKALEEDSNWIVRSVAGINCQSREKLVASLGGITPKRIVMEFNDAWFACFKLFKDMNITKISWTDDIHAGHHHLRVAVMTRSADVAFGSYERAQYDRFIFWKWWEHNKNNQPSFLHKWARLYKNVTWEDSNFVQVAHSAAHYFWLPFNRSPLASTALIGSINQWYPHRRRLVKMVDGAKLTRIHNVVSDTYACAIWAHCACIVTGGSVNYLVTKVFEVTATGSLLLLHHSLVSAARLQGFVDGVNMVVFNDTNIASIINKIHHNCSQFDNLRRAGQALTMSRHTTYHRVEQILSAIALFEKRRGMERFDGVPGLLNP